jgi:GNAT superfamily N-acetyltransferase
MINPASLVKMVRPHLNDIPEFPLPPGFSLRFYQPGDEENWFRIQSEADLHSDISRQLFVKDLGSDLTQLQDRQLFLLDETKKPIGTATAWFNHDFQGASYGRIHWVAITPAFQGRGLAKPLMTSVCRRLKELGHERAYLSTDIERVPAIKVYLQFGFVPLIRNDHEKKAWENLK